MKRLKKFGFGFIEPGEGELACGHEGPGRLPDPEDIVEQVLFRLSPKDLEGERILVSAGPTEEEIDPVRFLTNPSSGKMGFALAKAAAQRGAAVTLVAGPTNCKVPLCVNCVQVRSADQMHKAVMKEFPKATAVLMAAAVSDYRPGKRVRQKIKKKGAALNLVLEETSDILFELGVRKGKRVLIGFAAETESVTKHAKEKLRKKNLDLIVANNVSRRDIGFQSDRNQAKLIGKDGKITELPVLEKETLAHTVLDQIPIFRKQPQKKRGGRKG
jgi:phosphopantothenoylcysteine decarboxylase/phosphopantothenate--cysteine ligase